MEIREFVDEDWSRVWPIVREVVRAGDTYTYPPSLGEDEAREVWVLDPPGRTVVAVEGGDVVGTARMGPNKPGPGSHLANASYMVPSAARGEGVGRALCEHSLDWARRCGYAGMVFNAVVESNAGAVALYERLGFSVVGTVPGAFEHPRHGRVGLHVMHCPL